MKVRSVAALLLLAAGLVWIVRERLIRTEDGTSGTLALEVNIKSIEVRPTGDHAWLVLTAVFDQSGEAPVRLEPPLVSLLTARQTAAPRFIGPLLPEPVLAGPEPAEITLHFWLPLTDLKTPLILEAAGHRYPVDLPGG